MGAQISSFYSKCLPLSLFFPTSLSNSTASPPFHSPGEKFEVFVSFRGSDVHHGFLSHLFAALKGKQIHAFIDHNLERGKDITGSLIKIIEESDLSVVVFSQNYPKSKYCLEELVQIYESMKQRKQIVVPVFYQVDPSDVQELKGNYSIKKQKWRDALVEISNLAGFHSNNYSTDAELIDDVLDKVSAILCEIFPIISHNEGLFGIDSSIKDVEALLQFDSINDVKMVGIWGMGGIGKTTIASKVFHRSKKKFRGHCFVSNVKETLSIRGGLISLRDKIIRELLRDKDIKIDSSYSVDDFIRRRMKRTKALLVLDDILTSMELKSLLETSGLYSPDSFCPGSRIVVTSRDSHVLRDVQLKSDIYEANELKETEALHLFCWHAFGQNNPQQGYEKLSEKVVRYAHGVPLALVVLGSELKQKAASHWEDALKRFNSISPNEIQKILRISFDGLDRDEKNIFLDIACFLKGKKRDYVVNVLEDFGFHARVGINRLIDKSLLKEEEEEEGGGIITMHDLLEQMGKEIVAEEKESNGHGSRLWTFNDIEDALKNNRATQHVEALSLRDWHNSYGVVEINPEAFIHMNKLRFFEFNLFSSFQNSVNYMGLEFLPNSIKYLHWNFFPQNYWPYKYNSEKLVELHLNFSELEEIIWSKPPVSLKLISLRQSRNLMKISDLAMAPNLEVVDLSDCDSLVEVGSSLEKLNKLTKLNLKGCRSLSHLPELPRSIKEMELEFSGLRQLPLTVGGLTQLKQLSLCSCRELVILPTSISSLISLRVLDLSNCSRLVEIGPSLENLTKLTRLDVRGCTSFSLLPEIPSNILELLLTSSGLKQLLSTIGHLTRLKHLSFALCEKLESLPITICNLTSLETLDLSKCKNLQKLPEDFGNLKSLKELCASCSGLTELPSTIGHLTLLKELSLYSCEKLEILSSSICNLTSLKVMDVFGCSRLVEIGSSLENLTKLTQLDVRRCISLSLLPELPSSIAELHLSSSGLKLLPSIIGYLTLLKHLSLDSCVNLEILPSSFCNLISLETLDLSKCKNLQKLLEDFQNLKSLKQFGASCSGLTEFPSTIGHLTRLEHLWLDSFEKLESLPSSICNLTSLETLDLSKCKNLQKLPEDYGNLKSLKHLDAKESGLIELPQSIQKLKKLIKLDLTDCKKLKALPALPSSLEQFYASGCSSQFTEMKLSIVEHYRLKVNDQPTQIHRLCIDGAREVPDWMMYRNDCGTFISLELETVGHSISFIFYVEVSFSMWWFHLKLVLVFLYL